MRAVLLIFLSVPLIAADFAGKVVGISDGDTIRVLRDGREVRVRLYGVDCPESKQPFGTRARQFTSDLAYGRVVTVAVRDTDRYGRTVAEVILPGGASLNRELLRAGFAWWYRQFAPRDADLGRLEAEARQARRGLWGDPNPQAPWEWRRAPDRVGRAPVQ